MKTAPPVAITWQLSERSGWGMVGVAIAERLVALGRPPLLFEPPGQDLPASLIPYLEGMTSFASSARNLLAANPGRLVQVAPITMLHGFGNNLMTLDHVMRLTGSRNIALVAVEETTVPEERLSRLAEMDAVVVHSQFSLELFRGWGLRNLVLVHQGVDPALFAPRPHVERFGHRFVVFSGGKLEFRKGQDIVLAAFARFHARHPDSILVGAWSTFWPKLAFTMDESRLAGPLPRLASGHPDIPGWVAASRIPPDAFHHFGYYDRPALAEMFAACDLAVFPNRCESCTNLVAMEAMAAGLPCIVSANTGHRDLVDSGHVVALAEQTPVADPQGNRAGWGESSVEELAAAMERAYADRAAMRRLGAGASAFIRGERSWARFGERMVALADGAAPDALHQS